jgi:hypothetical protein
MVYTIVFLAAKTALDIIKAAQDCAIKDTANGAGGILVILIHDCK